MYLVFLTIFLLGILSRGIIRHDKNVYTMMVSVVFLIIVKKIGNN